MHFARVVRGLRHTYAVSITCPSNVEKISENIDDNLWNKKVIGGTLFLTAKTTRETGVGSFRLRGGNPPRVVPLDEGQKELLAAADNLTLDAEWSALISVLDTLGKIGYSMTCEGNQEGVFYMQSSRSLPPVPMVE